MKIRCFSRISLHELTAPSECAMNARDKMVYLVLPVKNSLVPWLRVISETCSEIADVPLWVAFGSVRLIG
jgi:hypothetical protein